MKNILVMLLILFASPQLFASEELVTVQVRGEGKIVDNNIAVARREAVGQAHKKAIALQIDSILDEKTIQSNTYKLDQRVYRRMQTFIKSYKEVQTEQLDDILAVTVEAVIDVTLLKNNLATSGLLSEQGGSQRVLVMVAIERKMEGKIYAWWMGGDASKQKSTAERTLNDILSSHRYEVVDPYEIRLDMKLPEDMRDRGVTIADAQSVGRLVGATYVIKGDLISDNIARLTLQAIDVRKGNLVASVAEETHVTDVRKIDDVESDLMRRVGNTLIEKLGSDIAGAGGGSQRLEIVVNGVDSFATVRFFEQWLKRSIPGAKSVLQRRVASGEVVFLVDYRGSVQAVARSLRTTPAEGYSLNVVLLDDGRLLLQVKQ